MNIKNKLLPLLIATASLAAAGCDSASESPYSPGGGESSGTNIPSQKNFVVLFDEPNPPVIDTDGFYNGGVEVEVSIHAADRYHLATTGATAYIDVDWGTLSATSCQIQSSGSCSVTWTSNANFDPEFFPADELITFTAWIMGEESFADVNGNGVFDDGDVFTNDSDGPFLDLNHDGAYTAGTDKILYPGNAAGTLTPANGLFDGPDCGHSSLCSGASAIYISDRAILSIREAP
ncbi:MAG TPA: hypothetical protein VIQ81_01215 [Gammaproteobacteria bacterium]